MRPSSRRTTKLTRLRRTGSAISVAEQLLYANLLARTMVTAPMESGHAEMVPLDGLHPWQFSIHPSVALEPWFSIAPSPANRLARSTGNRCWPPPGLKAG